MKLSMPRGLFRKYLVFLLILVGGLLSVSSAVELYFSYQETKQSIVRLERTKAQAAASEIERYLGQIVQHLRGTMQGAIDVSALGTAGIGTQAGGHSRAAALAEQREIDFLRLLRNVPAINEVRHLDLAGKEQLRTSRLALDAVTAVEDFADSPEFLGAKSKKTYFSPVYFRNESEPFITMAVAPDETAAEVTAAEVNIRAIWDVVARIGTGRAGNAYVVDSTDQLIAHPDLRLVLAKRDLSDAPQVKAARAPRAGGAQEEQMFTIAEGLQGGQALAVHAAIPALGWLVFIERPVEDTFAPLRAATARSVVVLALGLLLAILASVALARRMVAPIRRLQDGAARVGKGDLDHRIDIHTGDELKALADEFNRTTARLQDSQSTLEQKVEARTEALTRSVEEMHALGEVGRAVSSTLDLQTVLLTIITHAVELSKADAGGTIYEFDEATEVFEPRANYRVSDAYVRILHESRIRLGESAVGKCAVNRAPYQVPDVEKGEDSRMRDPLLREGVRARAGGAAVARGAGDRRAGDPAQGRGRVFAVAGDAAADFRQPVGARDPERAPVPRDRREGPAARGREPATIAVPRQHVARAAHAAERDHRRDRDAARGRARPEAGRRARAARARAARRQAPARADQRHSRSLQDRSRQDGPPPRVLRDRAADRRRGADHRHDGGRRTATR